MRYCSLWNSKFCHNFILREKYVFKLLLVSTPKQCKTIECAKISRQVPQSRSKDNEIELWNHFSIYLNWWLRRWGFHIPRRTKDCVLNLFFIPQMVLMFWPQVQRYYPLWNLKFWYSFVFKKLRKKYVFKLLLIIILKWYDNIARTLI